MHCVLIEFRKSTPYPVQLANALGDICQVTLMLPEDATQLINHVDQLKVNLHLFKMPKFRHPSNILMVKYLRQHLDVLRPDLVHITHWHLWGTPGLGMFSSFPLVATVHDAHRHPNDGGIWGIPSFTYSCQWHWADQVIVHANTVRQELVEEYGNNPDMVNVIPIGAYNFYRNYASANTPEKPNTILFFGRIWGYKGLEYLIEAEPLITRAVPDARIIIAGEGENFAKYEQAMVNRQHFEVHNYRIPNELVAKLFQTSSIVVLPYIEASQSGVIPLAYAFGKPVIATKVGGIPDVVDQGKTGYLVSPRDSEALADAIIKVLKNEKLRIEMGRNAQMKGKNELSWVNIAKMTLDVYEKIQAII